MFPKLIAIIDGDEVYVGCGSLEYLKELAYQQSYVLKYETGLTYIPFYIQDGYKILEEFTL